MHPMLSSFLSDLWAMEPGALSSLMESLASGDWKAAGMLSQDEEPETYTVDEDGTMTIPVAGVLLPTVPGIFRAFGINATGYDDIRDAIDEAGNDPAVKAVVLAIDSPGGSVSGIHAVADAIDDLTDDKPVVAQISGMAASAAYWIASQATAIYADRGSQVGSIGVYAVARDASVAAANAGIKVHVVSSAELKGAGVPGAPITDAQLAEMRRMIGGMASDFITDVARGRGKSTADILPSATGQIWMAAEALTRGLIDAQPVDDVTPVEDTNMDAFALIEKHPAHAALIAKMAKEGAHVDAMSAAIVTADAAAALASAKADMVAVKAEADALKVKLAEAEKARDQNAKQLADLNAMAAGGKAGTKVQQDGEEAKVEQLSQEKLEAMSSIERARFFARGGVVSLVAAV